MANLGAHRVVCNSAATERAFRASGGRTPTTTVYNGFDPAPFEAVTDDEVTDLRTTLGLGTAPTIGVFSRLAAWKGPHVLLDALPTLPDVHVLLVGETLFGEDDAYAARLRRQVADTGLQGLLRDPTRANIMAQKGSEHARSDFMIAEAARRVDAVSVQAAGYPIHSPVSPTAK